MSPHQMQRHRIFLAARDFDKLQFIMQKGTGVYIRTRGTIHPATFSGDRFEDKEGNTFRSPYSFSTHVTRLYKKSGGVPSGWSVIQTVDQHTGQPMTLAELYDNAMGRIFKD